MRDEAAFLRMIAAAPAEDAPRLVYAELDDGMIHKADYRGWISRSGRAWPARGEFDPQGNYWAGGRGGMLVKFDTADDVTRYQTIFASRPAKRV